MIMAGLQTSIMEVIFSDVTLQCLELPEVNEQW